MASAFRHQRPGQAHRDRPALAGASGSPATRGESFRVRAAIALIAEPGASVGLSGAVLAATERDPLKRLHDTCRCRVTLQSVVHKGKSLPEKTSDLMR